VGLLFVVWGLLRSRTEGAVQCVEMTFVPNRLMGGLCLAGFGIMMWLLFLFVVHAAPTVVLIGAIVAIPVGLFIAARSWTEACVSCQIPLEDHLVRVSRDQAGPLATAIRASSASAVVTLCDAPLQAHWIFLFVQYCERCRQVVVFELQGHQPRVVWAEAPARAVVQGLLSR
jgi:hypothetical protein